MILHSTMYFILEMLPLKISKILKKKKKCI